MRPNDQVNCDEGKIKVAWGARTQLFSIHSKRRGGRAVEGARLEIVYTAQTVSRVRIPLSPPAFALTSFHLR